MLRQEVRSRYASLVGPMMTLYANQFAGNPLDL